MNEVIAAKNKGCDHAVLVGFGEPVLWPNLLETIKEISKIGMTSSIITNGSVAVSHYAKIREAGLNHLHISVHGIGTVLDEISGFPGAGERQVELFTWLKKENWPWRMNMTVQQINYKNLLDIANRCVFYGCKHIISLGFLPHYEWNDPHKMREVAVHPAELRPYIEAVAQMVEVFNKANQDNPAMFTIRYHPMCHLSEEYRKYVTNARYVLYSPGEWDYNNAVAMSPEAHWQEALKLGGSVSIDTEPCLSCGLRIHCGGWNRVYAAGFDGAGLKAMEMPEESKIPGWLHDQNPSNSWKGWF